MNKGFAPSDYYLLWCLDVAWKPINIFPMTWGHYTCANFDLDHYLINVARQDFKGKYLVCVFTTSALTKISKKLPQPKQSLSFSCTVSNGIKPLLANDTDSMFISLFLWPLKLRFKIFPKRSQTNSSNFVIIGAAKGGKISLNRLPRKAPGTETCTRASKKGHGAVTLPWQLWCQ